ncbi:MAG: S8 family serine peptidase [Dysgonamonadaceae bacterium]|jgi:subtilisin family serine protease|nr:S8 family serine peptidase [Dysgonamonadaceae bacterium]
MKKAALLYISLLLFYSCNENIPVNPTDEVPCNKSAYSDFSENDVLKGRIRVKLKSEPSGEVLVRSANGEISTAIRSLDGVASTLKITRMERTFPYAGKYEERTRKEGLHLWYDLWFSEETASTRAADEVSVFNDIEVATPIVKIEFYGAPDHWNDVLFDAKTRASYPFNDPDLSKMWSYNNPGTESWQAKGADIRLFDVWNTFNGHPDIIIANVDGGIFVDHPDLKDNIWVNSGEIADNGIDDDGNGYIDDVYGYNFVSNTGQITPHRHGTHVAGIIAAKTNNGVGIAGIAGGNGTADSGVKLMSCQVFAHSPSDITQDVVAANMGEAIKYAADNGAIISQNSWGYAVNTKAGSSYIDPSHKAAIDYFVKYAGCDNSGNQLPNSPMKGGIVLFASGNAHSDDPRVSAPADYEKVIGVAAVGPDYKKPYYSNYGDFIDISAPGGIYGSAYGGIFSTTITEYGDYEYRYGTSMACPHVSAVAALVIEKNGVGKRSFTAKQLEEVLMLSAYEIDSYNPEYVGMLGAGCVNASGALNLDTLLVPKFQILSNPVSDGTFTFKVNSADLSGDALLSFINGTGSLVLRKTLTITRFKPVSIDISALAAGYYTLLYEMDGNEIREKIIKY